MSGILLGEPFRRITRPIGRMDDILRAEEQYAANRAGWYGITRWTRTASVVADEFDTYVEIVWYVVEVEAVEKA